MRRTSSNRMTSERTTNESSLRKKSRAVHLAASALAVTAALAGANALADHKGGYNHHGNDSHHHDSRYRHGPIYWNQQRKVRVHIPVRDHGPETLPLGRLIKQNSGVDLHHYRLVAVETRNGRFSNGYASLRTGNSRTQRYFLGSRAVTRIPAPSRADSTWRLRLGPGTQVRSVTAVLAPRHGRNYRAPANQRRVSVHERNHQAVQSAPLLGLAWLLANSDDDDRDQKQGKRMKRLRTEKSRTEAELAATKRKLERTRHQNKRLKDQRARLAEQRNHDREPSRSDKRSRASDGHKDDRRKGKGERPSEREVKRTVRYVVSAR